MTCPAISHLRGRDALAALDLLEHAESICRSRGVSLDVALGKARTKNVCRTRHLVWRCVYTLRSFSLAELGAMFGVDHTTILGAMRQLDAEEVAGRPLSTKEATEVRLAKTTVARIRVAS